MRKFIGRITLLLLVFACIAGLMEWLFRDYRGSVEQRFEQYETQKDTTEVLLLGNSHMLALGNPQIGSMPAFNFSFGGQDIFHMYTILRTVAGNSTQFRHVILGLDYELPGTNFNMENARWKDRLYYNNTGLLYDSAFANRLMARSRFFLANRNLRVLKQPKILQDTTPEALLRTHEEDCHIRATEHSRVRYDAALIPQNLIWLQHIIEICQRQRIGLTLLSFPKRSCYYAHYAPQTAVRGKQIADSVAAANGIVLLDYWQDSRFADSMFIDPDHLNASGAAQMLRLLTEEANFPAP